MKKLGLLVMPLMAMSILTGCSQPTPTPVVDVTHKFTFIGKFCTINGENIYSHDIYEKDKNVQYTIVPSAGYKLPETVEGVDFNPDNGVITISEIKADININVTAIPVPTPGATHVVSFDARGGTVTSDNPLPPIESGSRIATPPALADRAGYDEQEVTWNTKIDGSGDTFIFDATSGTQVVADMILYAQWGNISQFTVNFYSDDGNPYNSLQNIKVNYGDKVTYKDCPTDSTYDNHYNFDGWYTKKPSEAGAELFPFDTPLIGDSTTISIYAKHSKKNYHVTFDANGGEITSGGNPLDIAYMNSIPVDKRPTVSRSGYEPTTTWCTDKAGLNEFTFGSTSITDNTTLYAKWGSPTPSTTCTVTFDAGGGTYSTGNTISIDVQPNTKLSSLLKIVEVPTLANKIFAYYKYDGKGDLISYDALITSDVTLKAQYFDTSKVQKDTLDFTWDEIKQVAVTNKDPSTCFKLGATKKVKVDEKEHDVRIIDFKHEGDVTKNGDQTGITFEFVNVITKKDEVAGETTYWDESSTNYKYSTSTLNDFLNVDDNCIFNRLPSSDDIAHPDLKEVIEEVYKPVAETSSYEINTTYTTKLFPLSYREMSATEKSDYVKDEGTTYAFYIGSGEKAKKVVDGSNPTGYWLRSPFTGDINTFAWHISASGSFIYGSGGIHIIQLGVAPAFCI